MCRGGLALSSTSSTRCGEDACVFTASVGPRRFEERRGGNRPGRPEGRLRQRARRRREAGLPPPVWGCPGPREALLCVQRRW
eukprot:2932546-Prymnesium_polylepis.1